MSLSHLLQVSEYGLAFLLQFLVDHLQGSTSSAISHLHFYLENPRMHASIPNTCNWDGSSRIRLFRFPRSRTSLLEPQTSVTMSESDTAAPDLDCSPSQGLLDDVVDNAKEKQDSQSDSHRSSHQPSYSPVTPFSTTIQTACPAKQILSTFRRPYSASELVASFSKTIAALKVKQASAQSSRDIAVSQLEDSETQLTKLQTSRQLKVDHRKVLIAQCKEAEKRKKDNKEEIDELNKNIDDQQQSSRVYEEDIVEDTEELNTIEEEIAEAEQKKTDVECEARLEQRWSNPVDREFARSLGWGTGMEEQKMEGITSALGDRERGLELDDIAMIKENLMSVTRKVQAESEEVQGSNEEGMKIKREADRSSQSSGRATRSHQQDTESDSDSDDQQAVTMAEIQAEIVAMEQTKKSFEKKLRAFAGIKRKRTPAVSESSTAPSSSQTSVRTSAHTSPSPKAVTPGLKRRKQSAVLEGVIITARRRMSISDSDPNGDNS